MDRGIHMWDGVQKGKEGERLENKAEVKEEKSHM